MSRGTKVGFNLTRLISPSQGAGGAGWFALNAAKVSANQFDTVVLVRDYNYSWVSQHMAGCEGVNFKVINDIEIDAYDIIEGLDVYIDPLNGLEPNKLPATTCCIATIHDLLFMDRPEFFDQSELNFRSNNYGSAISRSDIVLTVSNEQKQKIETIYKKPDVRAVFQPPYFMAKSDIAENKSDNDLHYICYPSVQWNHKNHFRLYQAFLSLCKSKRIPENIYLVTSNILPVEANTSLHVDELRSSIFANRIVEAPYLDADTYRHLLSHSRGIVYPTLYEGYGIPVVEALMSGTPVLTSLDMPALSSIRYRPPNLFGIRNSADAALLAIDLEQFIHEAVRQPIAPHLSVASEVTFRDSIIGLIENAALQRVGQERQRPTAQSLPAVTRYQQGLTLHLLTKAHEDVGELATRVAGMIDAGMPSVVIYSDILAGMGAENARVQHAGVRFAYFNEGGASQDRSLLFELIFNQTKLAAILDTTGDLSEKIAAARLAAEAMAERKSLTAVRIAEHPGGLGKFANAILGRVLALDRIPLALNTTIEKATRLAIHQLSDPPHALERKLFIGDPSLKDAVGHHIGVARAIARGSRELGFNPIALANMSCPAELLGAEVSLIPKLNDFLYGDAADIGLFTYDIKVALRDQFVTSQDVLTLFCATPAMLAGVVCMLIQLRAVGRPLVAIRFDRDEARAPKSRIDYKRCFEIIRAFGLRQNFNFFVESIGLQDYFFELSGERFRLLFNPLNNSSSELQRIGLARRPTVAAKSQVVTVGYLGEARIEQGFQFLPFIVDYVNNDPATVGRVKFFIQTGASKQNDNGAIASARDQLRRLADGTSDIVVREFLTDDEYQAALDNIDILLLPYDAPSYNRRGSGVATEAIAAGKAMVVSKGTDIAGTYRGAGVVEPIAQNEFEFARACVEAVQNVNQLHGQTKAFCIEHPEYVNNIKNFVERIVEVEPVEKNTRGLVLWIANDTRGEGSQAVYDAQLDYLRTRGFTPIELHIPYPNQYNAENHGQPDFDWGAFLDELKCRPSFVPSEEYKDLARKIAERGNSYNNFCEAWRHLQFPNELKDLLPLLDFSLIVVNYAHHRAVLDTLNIDATSCPVICETHDIQAFQYAIQQRRKPNHREVEQEMGALAAFDQVVSISATEAKQIAGAVGHEKVAWALPPVLSPKVQFPLVEAVKRTDLLVVGSSHDANVISINWFLQNVYKPLLYNYGITLTVVGSVSDCLDTNFLSERVIYRGRVEDLSPYYEAATVTVLPIVSGAGVPIKVIDAFRRGVAFSLAWFPAAAMNIPSDFPLVTSGTEMAADLRELLTSVELRKTRAQIGQDFYVEHASRNAYFKSWDQVLRRLGFAIDDTLPEPNEDINPIKSAYSGPSNPTALTGELAWRVWNDQSGRR